MLGCDPLTALLGSGMDLRSPPVVWKRYLRALAEHGAAVRMLGPDVMVTAGVDDSAQAALIALAERYPPGMPMPSEERGVLAGIAPVDVAAERINTRVATYYRHIARTVGKDQVDALMDCAAITVSAGIHVAGSHLVAVVVPDAAALGQWRGWAAQASGDPREMHTAPTLVLATMPGGGIYLFRTPATAGPDSPPDPRFEPLPEMQMSVGACQITSGDLTVPIPPTRMYGHPVMRLGPCRMAPSWLEESLRAHGTAAAGTAA